MKQFFTLLFAVMIFGFTAQVSAQVADASGTEYLINKATTRADLVQITQDLAAKGITLNVKTVTFNSANQVMSIAIEVIWDKEGTETGNYETANVWETGDIWIIKTDTNKCVGDCK